MTKAERLKRAAFGVLSLLQDNLKLESVELAIEDEDEIVQAALRRHASHLSVHTITQRKLDPFKLLCWLGCSIVHRLQAEECYELSAKEHHKNQCTPIITALIRSLDQILLLETSKKVSLSKADKELLKRFLLAELGDEADHGIGFNGLYFSFHLARAAYKATRVRKRKATQLR